MRIPLHNILEAMFGIGQIENEEQMDKLISELKKLPPDMVVLDGKKLEEQLGKN